MSVPSLLSMSREDGRASAKRAQKRSEEPPGSHSPKSCRGPEFVIPLKPQQWARLQQRTGNET